MQNAGTEKAFGGKVVIITGASSGIGAITAVAFAKAGARLAIVGRNIERLKATEAKCREAGAEVIIVLCDLAEFENLEGVIMKTIERFNGIDILINNAAIAALSLTEEIEVDLYRRIFRINVDAPVFLSKLALPYLKKSKGCIVNVSSAIVAAAGPGSNPYGMTKAALEHFTKVLSSECSSYGIRVNSISPAVVDTEMWHNTNLPAESGGQLKALALKRQPLGIVTAEEVAESILFLCSAKKITGTTLYMDGGLLLFKGDPHSQGVK